MAWLRTHSNLLTNAVILCLLTVAAALSGYNLWHAGLHDYEYQRTPTFWASAELPRIPGTYILALSAKAVPRIWSFYR